MKTQDELRERLASLWNQVAKAKKELMNLARKAVEEDWDEPKLKAAQIPHLREIDSLKRRIFEVTETYLNLAPESDLFE
jgi:hypothetical protein